VKNALDACVLQRVRLADFVYSMPVLRIFMEKAISVISESTFLLMSQYLAVTIAVSVCRLQLDEKRQMKKEDSSYSLTTLSWMHGNRNNRDCASY
jgi:hypothetical protein